MTRPPQMALSIRPESAFGLLCHLFFLGRPVDQESAHALIPTATLDACLDANLIENTSSQIRPNALVVPVGSLLLAADLHAAVDDSGDCYVPTINQPAMHLSHFAVRRRARKTLDLCGGFALHGILASEFSDHVVSTDLNPRSKPFVEFNMALNNVENLECLTGDLFDAVQGEQFDLVLCNPPFVISPDDIVSYRDSPQLLDGFVSKMIADVPQYLAPGGLFQTICEWVEVEDEDWTQRLASWADGRGCDVWVLHANRQLPATYAKGRLRETTNDPAKLAAGQALWDDYFRRNRVAAIHGGFIFLRRRDGDNWFDITQITQSVHEPIGDAIWNGFQCRDLALTDPADPTLLSTPLRVASGLRQESHSRWTGDSWATDSITLRVDQGLPIAIGIDEHVRNLITLFDGERAVIEVLNEFADSLGIPFETASEQGQQMIRVMLKNGVLLPM